MSAALERALAEALPAECVSSVETSLGPRPLCTPRNDDEWRAVLAVANRLDAKVVARGAGTSTVQRPHPERVDLVLSTSADDTLVAYEPGDGVVTARAGARLAELRATVARGGHHLVPLLPATDRSTLGGALSAGRSGADRLRFGPLRHHVLGATILLADGSITKSGGALVKNVTGYDLFRLWTGAHGAFGIVLAASLRLFPEPAHTECVELPGLQLEAGIALARRLIDVALPPLAVELEREGDAAWRLRVVHAGTAAVLAEAWRQTRSVSPELEAPRTAGDWVREPAGAVLLRLTSRPPRLGQELAACLTHAGPLVREVLVRPGVGEALLELSDDAAALLQLERALSTALLDARWLRAPDSVLASALARERRAPGFALMRKLRERYDPAGRFAPGRFHGGL